MNVLTIENANLRKKIDNTQSISVMPLPSRR